MDLQHGQVSVPEKKLSNLRKLLEDACNEEYAGARHNSQLDLLGAVHRVVHKRVRWFTDSQNVVRILQVGSAKPHLQSEAVAVFDLCL